MNVCGRFRSRVLQGLVSSAEGRERPSPKGPRAKQVKLSQ